MKLALRASLVCLAFSCFAGQASAAIVYKLVDVKLGYLGGEALGGLTGTFTVSDDLQTLISANIEATGATASGGHTYVPSVYAFNPGDSVNNSSLIQNYIRLNNTSLWQELYLVFTSPLTGSGSTDLFIGSYESQHPAGGRIVLSGWVEVDSPAAIPEPSSLATLFIGAPIALAVARRCRRAAKSA